MTDRDRRDAELIEAALGYSRAALALMGMGREGRPAELLEAAARLLGMVGRGESYPEIEKSPVVPL